MKDIKSIAVFCGSKPGADPAYGAAARELGGEMAARGLELVFGGGRIGMMGIIADAVIEGGGKVTGVIPQFLEKLEVGYNGGTDLITVTSMHERKNTMFSRADAFV
ncbi:MAG: LOG family protein, partial [Rhodospirillales bacterium]|nr:LOG family protein [Rhodospirillales bacterium]